MCQQVVKTRERELGHIWGMNVAEHLHGAMWQVLPIVNTLASFGVYSWLGNTLGPKVTFTSLSLFDEIRDPMLELPEVMADVVNGWKSIVRVSEFLAVRKTKTPFFAFSLHRTDHLPRQARDKP